MKVYFAFFKVHTVNLLQYKLSAYAGIIAQVCWALMNIFLYKSFYDSNNVQLPMSFSEVVTYMWLQQAFFTLFITWYLDREILSSISSGQIAYELCRPSDLYDMWFVKNIASRVAKALFRFIPIILLAFLMPQPYRLSLPQHGGQFLLFLISMLLALFLVVAFCMLIYVTTFYTISSTGVRMVMSSLVEFLAGAVIPLPFFPDALQTVINLLPFASMQNVPFRIFSGNIQGTDALYSILIQLFWLISLVLIGKLALRRALKNVVVQGG
ncbi:ABC transporter permease [Paenibacillus massiliensis]|uniref:ABC transporter permease n=1 Tax=Paenibacillus massiliensis TaxID=225917 RepID=UPI00035F49C5|nr:ABC-2 family transporter protein [Paenibacillus massiliensis]